MIQHLTEWVGWIGSQIEWFNTTRMEWGKDPTVNLVLTMGCYGLTVLVLATYLVSKRSASDPAHVFYFAGLSAMSAFGTISLLTTGEGVWKTQALALLIFYGVSTFIFVSEWLIERGARYLTQLRGDRWIKELELPVRRAGYDWRG
jgi:FtsH-binding integral membrane protein